MGFICCLKYMYTGNTGNITPDLEDGKTVVFYGYCSMQSSV